MTALQNTASSVYLQVPLGSHCTAAACLTAWHLKPGAALRSFDLQAQLSHDT